jgi:hypothetical protein
MTDYRLLTAAEVSAGGLHAGSVQYAVALEGATVVSFFIFDVAIRRDNPCPTCEQACLQALSLYTVPAYRNQHIFTDLYNFVLSTTRTRFDNVYHAYSAPTDNPVIVDKYSLKANADSKVIPYNLAQETAEDNLARIQAAVTP